jgi:TetR/AcrR family fatty acid metabolism transcriptional regulator
MTDRRVLRARALRDKRRVEILQAARKVFARRGYLGASIADIIDEANIARGTFYLHFESKRSIFGEILEDLLDQLKSVIVRVDVTRKDASPYDQLLDIVEHVLDVLVENADLARILLKTGGGQDDEFDQKMGEFYEHALALIRGSLSDGVEMGIVRDVDLSIYASCVLGGIKETVDQLLIRRAKPPRDRRAVAKKLLDYNLFGIIVR